jgi:hypothetical protein
MMRLAKEPRDIGGERSQHFLTLVDALAAGHQRAIIAKTGEAQRAQSLGQPRIDQRGLGFRQMDAGVLMQHGGDLAEVVARQMIFARRQAGASVF